MKAVPIAGAGLMSMGDVARYCEISRQAVRVHFLAGRLPAADHVGRILLFARHDVETFREWHSQHPASQVAKRLKRTA